MAREDKAKRQSAEDAKPTPKQHLKHNRGLPPTLISAEQYAAVPKPAPIVAAEKPQRGAQENGDAAA